eukprot:82376-Rhodomonas_salina.1
MQSEGGKDLAAGIMYEDSRSHEQKTVHRHTDAVFRHGVLVIVGSRETTTLHSQIRICLVT